MFDNLSGRLQVTLKRLRGEGRLTEDNIRDALREVRTALLEADVALPVVKDFIERVRVKAVGREVASSLSPGQVLIKVVYDELVALMGSANEKLNLAARPPAVMTIIRRRLLGSRPMGASMTASRGVTLPSTSVR